MKLLSSQEKDQIRALMNPEGSNFKDVNWFKLLSREQDGHARVEVGYWITYLNCRPKYNKEVLVFKLKEDDLR